MKGRPQNNLGRECAFCLMKLGYGYQALWKKLRIAMRRAGRYRIEGGFPMVFPDRKPLITAFGSVRKGGAKLPKEEAIVRYRNRMRRYAKNRRDNLSDGYVKHGLVHKHGFSRDEITPEIIEIKRLQLQCQRAFRES